MNDTNAISFDKVEATAPAACTICKGPLAPHYFSANGHPVCATCRPKLDLERGPLLPRLLLTCLVGGAVSVGGALVYWGITAATGYNLALITIAVGYAVGAVVRRFSRGGGRGWQVLAVFLTYASFSFAQIAPIREALMHGERALDPITSSIAAFVFCWATPVFALMDDAGSGLIGLLIVAFGLHAAWKATRKLTLDITGPFDAAPAPAPATP